MLTGILPQVTSFYRAKIKHQKNIKVRSSINFPAPVACSHMSEKQTDDFIQELKNMHPVQFTTTSTREHFQHLKSLIELSPDEKTSGETLETNLCGFAFNNFVIIDKADHWSALLYRKELAIRRQKPQLDHGTIKAIRELVIFY